MYADDCTCELLLLLLLLLLQVHSVWNDSALAHFLQRDDIGVFVSVHKSDCRARCSSRAAAGAAKGAAHVIGAAATTSNAPLNTSTSTRRRLAAPPTSITTSTTHCSRFVGAVTFRHALLLNARALLISERAHVADEAEFAGLVSFVELDSVAAEFVPQGSHSPRTLHN